jgi:hypothetical protein
LGGQIALGGELIAGSMLAGQDACLDMPKHDLVGVQPRSILFNGHCDIVADCGVA